MNEAETRAEHIDPALKAAGWGVVEGSRVMREYRITEGRLQGAGQRSKPEIADYVSALKQKSRKPAVLALRQLLRLVKEYPRQAVLAAVAEAAHYGLYEPDRLERMILRCVAREYFRLGEDGDD